MSSIATTKSSFKVMLTPTQRRTLNAKVKSAKQAAKKAQSDLKLLLKKVTSAEKALALATKAASDKKTPAARKAKIRAADNLKTAKVKLRVGEEKAIAADQAVIVAEFNLDIAEQKQEEWLKAITAFEKQWERDYKQKSTKKVSAKKASTAKKVSGSKKAAATSSAKVAVKPAPKAEKPVVKPVMKEKAHTQLVVPTQPSVLSVVEKPPVYEKPQIAEVTKPEADNEQPLNPIFPNGFSINKDDNN